MDTYFRPGAERRTGQVTVGTLGLSLFFFSFRVRMTLWILEKHEPYILVQRKGPKAPRDTSGSTKGTK